MDYKDKSSEELRDELKKLKKEYDSLQHSFQLEISRREAIEARLQLNEEEFKILTNSTLEIIFIIDKSGRIIFFNGMVEVVLGYSVEEATGQPFTKFVPVKEIPRYLMNLKNVFLGRDVSNFITQVYHKNGNLLDVEINGKLSRYKGEIVGQGTIREISGKKKTERDLEASLRSYKGLFDSVSEAIYIHKEDGVFIDVNIGATIMYGYSRSELIGKDPGFVSAPGMNNMEEVLFLTSKVMETGIPRQFEFWGMRKNGEIFPKDVIMHKGQYFGEDVIITTARDVTERRQSEERLRLYKEIIEHSTEAIAIMDKNGLYLEQNAAHEKLIGYSDKEMVGKSPAIHLGDEAFNKVAEEIIRTGKYSGELVSHTKHGDVFLDVSIFTLKDENGDINCCVGIKRDITERKNAEQALKESEAKYRILAEKMHDVVWILNLDLETVYVSPSTEYTLGYTQEERIKMRMEETLVPESLDHAMQVLINEAVTTQEGKAHKDRGVILELEYYHKDGSTRWLEQSINGIYDEKGELTGIMGVARDITERKKAQDALKESLETYRGLFNTVTDAIYVLDKEGKFIDVNEGAVKMYGYPHDVLVGKDPGFVSAPGKNNMEQVVAMVNRAYEGEQQHFEFWGLRSNGEIFLKDVSLYKGHYFGQNVIVAMARDITNRKQSGHFHKHQQDEPRDESQGLSSSDVD